jgi:hypothetical protein
MCVCERDLSKLRIVKGEPGFSMGREKLSTLALVIDEHDLLHSLDFIDVIEKFAFVKARETTLLASSTNAVVRMKKRPGFVDLVWSF